MDTKTLKQYGASLNKLRLFDEPDSTLLPYATLETARAQNEELSALQGVYEWQENPLIYLIDGEQLDSEEHFQRIRRMAAMRGDAPYLGVVNPGQLTVHRLALDKESYEKSQIKLEHQPQLVFSYLINQRPSINSTKRNWIAGVVLKLLREAIHSLINSGLTKEDSISLAGRALFTRFLADRELLNLPLIKNSTSNPAFLFDTAKEVQITSEWLDKTFNGEFLPLSLDVFQKLNAESCNTLGNILRRADGKQLYLGWEEKWDYLDFAHIPVGVLSQAYEQYMREHDETRQRKEGSYYTPRTIVDLMTSGAFHALRREGNAHQAKVLDPAVGAGVFLISAFRHLVAERWEHDKQRPDTQTLRDILYHQITGFDINEEALRFAALGLYLISIELDPHPEPVTKLRFEYDLRDRVLFKFAGGDPKRPLGSLGSEVGDEHIGLYDLVIGNPPWPTGTKLPHWDEVKKIVARIAQNRLPEGSPAPPLPNEGLDLPFVWRAMEWARPSGQIAFALHARLLFQQGEGTPEARNAIFTALDVTGIINGAELREKSNKVWPEIAAPFCVLFAKNQAALPSSGFRFVTPHIEKTLNNAGMLRIDASNSEIITVQQIKNRPEICKILFCGTQLDLEIFEKISNATLINFGTYWDSILGESGNGYQKLRKSSRIRKNSQDQLPGISSTYLADLPNFTSEALNTETMQSLMLDVVKLPIFNEQRIHDPRSRSIFRKPLLIIHQTPKGLLSRVKTFVAEHDVVFTESFNGYSAYKCENADLLVRYLALFLSSKPALWYVLMRSGKFAVERGAFEKLIIDEMPVIPLEKFSMSEQEKIQLLFDKLNEECSTENWAKVDAWAAELFGLSERDLQVISDTLKYNLPFVENKKAAQAVIAEDELKTFCTALATELAPWEARKKVKINIKPVDVLPDSSPWVLLRLENNNSLNQVTDNWTNILRIADELGTTEVILPDETGLWIARLNQARYWSQSQARLLTRRLIWEHKNALFGRRKVA